MSPMTSPVEPPAASPQPGQRPPAPLPKAVQFLLLALLLSCIGGMFWLTSSPPPEIHGVRDARAYQGVAPFEVDGEVLPTSEENLALRALEGYESFTLGDRTGEMPVYFRASSFAAPADGARVRVEGHKVQISGVGALAFVAEHLTVLR